MSHSDNGDFYEQIINEEELVYSNAFNNVYITESDGINQDPSMFINTWRLGLVQGAKYASELFEYQGLATQALYRSQSFGNKRENAMKKVATDLLHMLEVSPGLLKSSLTMHEICSCMPNLDDYLAKIRSKARQLGSLIDVYVTGEAVSQLSF